MILDAAPTDYAAVPRCSASCPARAGAFPFQVARPTLLHRLFEAVHVQAPADIVIERDTAAIDQLLAAGAESHFDLVSYRGAL